MAPVLPPTPLTPLAEKCGPTWDDVKVPLAERIGLASRYYIKNVQSSESLLPDEAVGDLVKDAHVNLLQLNPVEVSTQLMVEDFTIFRQIEATEYVEDLFIY